MFTDVEFMTANEKEMVLINHSLDVLDACVKRSREDEKFARQFLRVQVWFYVVTHADLRTYL